MIIGIASNCIDLLFSSNCIRRTTELLHLILPIFCTHNNSRPAQFTAGKRGPIFLFAQKGEIIRLITVTLSYTLQYRFAKMTPVTESVALHLSNANVISLYT